MLSGPADISRHKTHLEESVSAACGKVLVVGQKRNSATLLASQTPIGITTQVCHRLC